MATYRQIYITFWSDPKIDDDFTPEDKYFYLYLLTNSHTSISGCYEISMKQCSRELGYNDDTIRVLLRRMEDVHKVIKYCAETKEVLLLNWYKYNWSSSPNFKKGITECIPYIKNKEFRQYVINRFEELKGKGKQSTTVDDSMSTSVSVSDTDCFTESVEDSIESNRGVGEERGKEEDKKKAKKGFNPPTLEEVKAYAREKGFDVDCEFFWEYYSAGNWIDGKGNPVKNWKQKLITWAKHRSDKNGTGSNRKNGYGQVDGNDQGLKQKYSDLVYFDANDESTWGIFDG